MKLEEQIIRYTPTEFEDEYTEKLAKIAEDFAIGFAEWCIENYHIEGISRGILDDKELLEIYKQTL